MSDTMEARQTWEAFGPAGALGAIHRTDGGFTFTLMDDAGVRGTFPSLQVAKSALHASLEVGADWPDFREH